MQNIGIISQHSHTPTDAQRSPREIEEVLHSHTGVQEAHVIGVPDDVYGEQVMAWVRMRDGGGDATAAEASLREHCRGTLLDTLELLCHCGCKN